VRSCVLLLLIFPSRGGEEFNGTWKRPWEDVNDGNGKRLFPYRNYGSMAPGIAATGGDEGDRRR